MFDSRLRRHIDPVSNRLGRGFAELGVSANAMTIIGFFFGLMAFATLVMGAPLVALVFVILNRIADGLDGAIARHNGVTDLGGYLDIVTDFIFYALIPLGFALDDPSKAQAACFLVVSFVGTGSSFLAFAILAAKNKLDTSVRDRKSFYYLGGLTEGTETIALLILMCLMPHWFVGLALGFGALCWITTATRIYEAIITFGPEKGS